jgi:hypothetical protein
MVVDFAHAHKMEAFASVRMNDVHDSFIRDLQTIWKRRHPELLVETTGVLPSLELYVTAQDFSHAEVRRRKLEIIQEICDRYDVDGFELDYIRHPVLFSRSLRGLPVTEEEVATMTSLMRRIRQITEKAAGPELIAVRDKYYACLQEIGDPQALDGKDKLFCVDNGAGSVFPYYAHISSPPPLPVISKSGVIRQGVVQRVPLLVGDDVGAAALSNRLRELKLMINVRGPEFRDRLLFRLNNEILTGEELAVLDEEKMEYRLAFPITAPPLKQGRNFLEIAQETAPSDSLEFYGIQLKVDYK